MTYMNKYVKIISSSQGLGKRSPCEDGSVSSCVCDCTGIPECLHSNLGKYECFKSHLMLLGSSKGKRSPPTNSAVLSAFVPKGSNPPIRTGPCDDAQLVCSYLVIFSEAYSVKADEFSCGVN